MRVHNWSSNWVDDLCPIATEVIMMWLHRQLAGTDEVEQLIPRVRAGSAPTREPVD